MTGDRYATLRELLVTERVVAATTVGDPEGGRSWELLELEFESGAVVTVSAHGVGELWFSSVGL